jgi:hypothetical protein
MLSGYSYDGSHFTPKGAYYAGLAVKELLEALVPPSPPFVLTRDDVYDATYNTRGDWLTNALFQGTGGTKTGTAPATGTVADGWILQHISGAGGCVASLVARTDVPGGYWQQLVFTQADSDQDLWYLRRSDGSTALDADNWYQGYSTIEWDAGDDILVGAFVEALDKGDAHSNFSQYPYDLSGTNYTLPNINMPTLTHETPPFQPTVESGLRFRHRIYLKGANTNTFTLRIGGAHFRMIDSPELTWTRS